MPCSIIGLLQGMMYKKVSRGANRMSISKKKAGVILLIIAVIGFGYWLFHEDEVVPDFSSNNKIELIANVLENRNADKIREAGYGIPSDSVIRRLGGIDMLEMDGELNLKVRVPSPDDSEILVLFSTVDDGKKIDGAFLLDKEWNLIYSSYHTIGKDNTRKEVKLTDSQEKELLQKVQKELNQFLDKMKEQLGR